MKNLIYMFSFLMITSAFAQEPTEKKKPVDKMEETTTTKTTVNKNGVPVTQSTVKVTTKKEQQIKTKQRPGNTPDGDKVDTPIKVTKTIEIDRDSDPFYDVSDKTVYYNYNDKRFAFKSDPYGFNMMSDNSPYGQARISKSNHFYLTNINGYPGVGYFDTTGNFIVEYYNKDKDVMVMESYEMTEF